MTSFKIMLEIDQDTGALLSVRNEDDSPALVNTKERRKWQMNDIHISSGKEGSASPSPRMACPGKCSLWINNFEYCFNC